MRAPARKVPRHLQTIVDAIRIRRMIQSFLDTRRDVYAYFNNDSVAASRIRVKCPIASNLELDLAFICAA
jgi:hypothetical protein